MATTTKHLNIKTRCPLCNKTAHVKAPPKGYTDWFAGGAHIQDALPELTAVEREQLITGTCGPCWIDMFGTDDDDEAETA